ncbi:hypothetical protein STEG23_026498, partial [Scotinomys teguina]
MRANVQAQHHQMVAEVAAPYIMRTSRRACGSGAPRHADITQSTPAAPYKDSRLLSHEDRKGVDPDERR